MDAAAEEIREAMLSSFNRSVNPRLVSVGTATPPNTYTQQDLLELFKCDNPLVRRFFESSHIRKRHLVLPEPGPDGKLPTESGEQLIAKHKKWGLRIGSEAVMRCLHAYGARPSDVDYLMVISSTGFLCPGLASYLVTECGMRANTHRVDMLGMGCNAGINGLVPTSQWAAANPGGVALMVCIEVCSAAYVFDMTVRTGVVNSLFGDGAAAALVVADRGQSAADGPEIIDFECLMIPEAREEMRFDFEAGKFSFYLGWEIPYLIGEHIGTPVNRLLARAGLKRRDIKHWVIHSGGKKVVDSIKYNIGINEHDVRHTRSILKDYGNLSSGSFLFSYQELQQEDAVRPGDWGMFITMGPGVSIETALVRW